MYEYFIHKDVINKPPTDLINDYYKTIINTSKGLTFTSNIIKKTYHKYSKNY